MRIGRRHSGVNRCPLRKLWLSVIHASRSTDKVSSLMLHVARTADRPRWLTRTTACKFMSSVLVDDATRTPLLHGGYSKSGFVHAKTERCYPLPPSSPHSHPTEHGRTSTVLSLSCRQTCLMNLMLARCRVPLLFFFHASIPREDHVFRLTCLGDLHFLKYIAFCSLFSGLHER